MLLPPLKDPCPHVAAGPRHPGLLAAVSPAEALDLACRTLVGALRVARPRFETPPSSALLQHPLQEVEQG